MDEQIKVLRISGKLRGTVEPYVAKAWVENKEYKWVSSNVIQKIRVKRIPAGWKRTHDIKPEQVNNAKIIVEWTNKKTGNKVVITRYYCPGVSRSGYGYNIVEFNTKLESQWGDEGYSLNEIYSQAFRYYMKEEK